jgi:hypothetical protein
MLDIDPALWYYNTRKRKGDKKMVDQITIRKAKKNTEIIQAVVLAYGAMTIELKTRINLIIFNDDGRIAEEILRDEGVNVIKRKVLI